MELKEAIRILLREEHLGDWVYDIRDRARESDPKFEGNSWEHPRVNRFCDCVHTLEEYLRSGNAQADNDSGTSG